MRDDDTTTARSFYASVERFFALPAGSVGPATTAEEVAAWDSVSHVGLILAMEEEYGIVFDVASVGDFRNIGELAAECSRLAGPDFVPAAAAPIAPASAPAPAPATPMPPAAPPAVAPAELRQRNGFLGWLRRLFG